MIFEYKNSKIHQIKLDDLLLHLDKRHNTLHSILKKHNQKVFAFDGSFRV